MNVVKKESVWFQKFHGGLQQKLSFAHICLRVNEMIQTKHYLKVWTKNVEHTIPFRVFGSVYHAEIVINRWTFAIFIAFKIDSIVCVNFTITSSTCFGKPRTEIITSCPSKIGAKDSGLKMSPLTTLSFSWVTVTRLGSLTMAVQVQFFEKPSN